MAVLTVVVSKSKSTDSSKEKEARDDSVEVEKEEEPSECELAGRCVGKCRDKGVRVCRGAALAAGRQARRAVETSLLSDDTVLFRTPPEFVHFDFSDVEMGKKLGEGGFCVVRNVDIVKKNEYNNAKKGKKEGDDGKGRGPMLAVKHLKRSTMMDPEKFRFCAGDLAVEAHFMAKLNGHKHILRLHGVAAGTVESAVASSWQQDNNPGYFLILDRIFYTLTRKIQMWRREAGELSSDFLARITNDYKDRRMKALVERLLVAIQICDAMVHVHSKGIVYRDLKAS